MHNIIYIIIELFKMIASLGMQASCQGVNRDRDKVGKGAS